ncbi:CynX/NimT family MFS transporter [Nisaea denitrificans]|uniref:MFS transporter n=1 Tax=Nisaea denitrificans TaxID=390877 RepID=UPI00040BCDA4|nr:MFS transporter [Nisaea denitrificans]
MNQTIDVAAADPTQHPYRWAMLFGVWLIYFAFGLTISALAPMVGPITHDLGLSHGAMGTVLGAWPFIYIGAAVPCGILLDRIGARRALLLAAMIMAASGLCRAMAVDHISLFLAVGIFGFGGPLISIGAPKIIAEWFEGKERGFAMGIYITGPAIGGILSLSLTNAVVLPFHGGDWRMVVTDYAAITAAAGFIWLLIARHAEARAREVAEKAAPKRPQIEIFRELMANPVVRVILAMSVGIFFFNHGTNNWLPEILKSTGMSAVDAGYWAALPTMVGVLGSLTIPRLATPERRGAILGGLFVLAGLCTLLLQLGEGPGLILALIFQGVARGSMMTIALLFLVEARGVGSKNAGSAGGLFFSAAEIGGVSGPVAIGVIHDMTGGFTVSLWVLTGVCALLLLGLVFGIQRPAAKARV